MFGSASTPPLGAGGEARFSALTQEVLAQLVGCTADAIKKIEADSRRPSLQLAERLADCLAVPPEQRPASLRTARAELRFDRLELPADPAAPSIGPSATVTFLFTAIEAIARLWERHQTARP